MYSHYAGALLSRKASEVQAWHRDAYHLFDSDEHEVGLPPCARASERPVVVAAQRAQARETWSASSWQT